MALYLPFIFFYKGFGLSSYLFCSFFFVTGVNLLFGEKIFSPWRNFRYIIAGLLFFSTALAFITHGNGFPWGGETGNITSNWLRGLLGEIGTAVLLLAGGFAYFIWRFNPSFSLPAGKSASEGQATNSKIVPVDNSFTEEAKLFMEEDTTTGTKGNTLKHHGGVVVINPPGEDDPENKITLPEVIPPQTTVIPKRNKKSAGELELQINTQEEAEDEDNDELPKEKETEVKKVQNLPPYDPILDLKDYKYPSLDLLETHGSEKIVLDASELEANKHQIINTLKNYDIDIRQISATVGPTVTLYEIVPAAGVRISRIKNLEDDIALSLAALGIRIIAPIPGKGTIGIEVPNVKKTIVSMKGLLSTDRFQQNKFSLPIALGKKIDNEHFIVDLATMPHLLMAGATGQGKSVD